MLRLTDYSGSQDNSSGFDGVDIDVDASGKVWLVGLTIFPSATHCRRAMAPRQMAFSRNSPVDLPIFGLVGIAADQQGTS